MDLIIRPATTSDFDSVVHIMNQVQALHVNWRSDIYRKVNQHGIIINSEVPSYE